MTQCSICLSPFKQPVCLPCGHIYCKLCLNGHVNGPANQRLTSTCPDCRAVFHLVAPDLTYLPEKYHPFISHAIRRVYIDTSPQAALEKQLKDAQTRLAAKHASDQQLLNRCEGLVAALAAHKQGEKEANARIMEMEEEMEEMRVGMKERDEKMGQMEKETANFAELRVHCFQTMADAQTRSYAMQMEIDQLKAQLANCIPKPHAAADPSASTTPHHKPESTAEANSGWISLPAPTTPSASASNTPRQNLESSPAAETSGWVSLPIPSASTTHAQKLKSPAEMQDSFGWIDHSMTLPQTPLGASVPPSFKYTALVPLSTSPSAPAQSAASARPTIPLPSRARMPASQGQVSNWAGQ